jgi:hypothetical protein
MLVAHSLVEPNLADAGVAATLRIVTTIAKMQTAPHCRRLKIRSMISLLPGQCLEF